MDKEKKVIPEVKLLNKDELEILDKVNYHLISGKMTNFALLFTEKYWNKFGKIFGTLLRLDCSALSVTIFSIRAQFICCATVRPVITG